MTESERYLSVREIQRLTGLSERTIRGMIADGRLPAVRPEGLRVVRIPERAIRILLGARTREGRDER